MTLNCQSLLQRLLVMVASRLLMFMGRKSADRRQIGDGTSQSSCGGDECFLAPRSNRAGCRSWRRKRSWYARERGLVKEIAGFGRATEQSWRNVTALASARMPWTQGMQCNAM